jgi:hypothetical protein
MCRRPEKNLLVVKPAKQFFVLTLIGLDNPNRFHVRRVFVRERTAHPAKLARAGAQGFLNQVNVANAQLERFVVTRHDPLLRRKGMLFPIRRN